LKIGGVVGNGPINPTECNIVVMMMMTMTVTDSFAARRLLRDVVMAADRHIVIMGDY